MAKELGPYDTELQMFVQPVREPSINHLRFLRRLAEAGKFSHRPFSAPRGEYVARLTDPEIKSYVISDTKSKALALREHVAATGGE